MRWLWATMIGVLILLPGLGSTYRGSQPDTPAFAASSHAKAKCHYVIKKVHGKKKRVKVCKKPKPTPTPRPTATPTAAPESLHLIDQGGYLWIDGGGNVWVSSGVSPNGRVSKLSPGGALLATFQSDIDGATGVAVDGQGNVYVVDNGSDRVVKFSSSGEQLGTIGTPDNVPGELSGPSGIGLDGNGHLFVADSNNSRIQEYTIDGRFVATIGAFGADTGQLDNPRDVTLDSQGNLFVADTHNNRVEEFSSSGAFVRAWGTEGSTPGQFEGPEGICLDGAGHVYVADTGNRRVQVFSPDGTPLAAWSTGDYEPVSPGVDAAGNVYVTEDTAGGTARVGYGVAKYSSDGRLLSLWQ